MKIYLVQHGESLGKELDPQQSLSKKGTTDIERLSHFIDRKKIEIAHLFHSGKQRAEQTAAILAASLSKKIELHQGLKPLDDVNPIADEINQQTHDIMIVGHMPFISKLVGKLVLLNEERSIIAFVPGTMICLEKTNQGRWFINWVRRPD